MKERPDQATREAYEFLDELRREAPFVRAGKASGGPLKKFYDQLLASPDMLDDPRPLTKALRLPWDQQFASLEYLNNSGPYVHDGPVLRSLIKNVSTQPIDVLVKTEDHYHYSETGEQLDTWDTELFYETLEPGKTIELDAPRGVQALQNNCRTARLPKYWRKWSGTQDVLREVGYVCRVNGQIVGSREHAPQASKRSK